jgi:hypothetical protein
MEKGNFYSSLYPSLNSKRRAIFDLIIWNIDPDLRR